MLLFKKLNINQSITRWLGRHRADSAWHCDDLLESYGIRSILRWIGRIWCDSVEIERFQSTLRWFWSGWCWDDLIEAFRWTSRIERTSSISIRLSWKWKDELSLEMMLSKSNRIKRSSDDSLKKIFFGRNVDNSIGIRMILSNCRWFGRN